MASDLSKSLPEGDPNMATVGSVRADGAPMLRMKTLSCFANVSCSDLLLDRRGQACKLRSQVDPVSISENQNRPKAVRQFMAKALVSIGCLPTPVHRQHQLR